MKEIDPAKNISDIVMFDGNFNVQFAGRILKVYYTKFTVICGVEYTVSFFSNDVSKIPIANQMIFAHNMLYNILGSGIYPNLCSIFKSRYQEFHN